MTEQVGGHKPPSYLSPSAMDTYNNCPLRFYFNRIEKIPEKTTEPQIIGTMAHAVLEHLFMLPEAERTQTAARDIARKLWAEGWEEEATAVLKREHAVKQFMWKVWYCIEEYFVIEDPTAVHPGGLEFKMQGEIEGVPMVGIIDRWHLDPWGSAVVTDYKTGKIPAKKYEAPKIAQLTIYSILFPQVFDHEVSTVELIYIKSPGAKKVYSPTDELKAQVAEQVKVTWDKLLSSCETGLFPPRKTPLCNWCSYKSICPAWTK